MAVDETRDNNLRSWIRQGVSLATFLQAQETATAAATLAAAAALAAQQAVASQQENTDFPIGAVGRVFCPAGVTPDRPSNRTDISFIWFSPSPPSTADGKLMPGVDFWCVLDI